MGPIPSNRAISTTNKIEAKVTPTARSTVPSGIWRRCNSTSWRPCRVERVAPIKMANVVVLIPPPVPPGLAPINISTIISSKPASVIAAADKGMVLNPAVRVEIDWNRLTWNFCHGL